MSAFTLLPRAMMFIAAIITVHFFNSSMLAQTSGIPVSWSSIGSGLNGTVNSIAFTPSGEILAGGAFYIISNDIYPKRLARWNNSSGSWSAIPVGTSNGFNNVVYSLAVSNDGVYIGGTFDKFGNGSIVNYISIWNSSTGSLAKLGSAVTGVNAAVRAIAVSGNDIFAGGTFDHCFETISAYHIAKWNAAAGTWTNLPCGDENGLNGVVQTIAVSGDYIYIGGQFTSLTNGVSVNHIARWDKITNTWSPLPGPSFNGVNGNVYAIAVSGNDIFVGGDFTRLGNESTPANRIAKWNSAAGTWSVLACGSSNGVNMPVRALAAYGNDIYAGGDFTRLGDSTIVNRIARWNTSSGSWSTLTDGSTVGVNGSVNALAVNSMEGKLYAGGTFTIAGTCSTASRIAKMSDSGNPLPVELASFEAGLKGTKAVLNWRTVTETNNFGFDVERSVSANSANSNPLFEKIGFVKGCGNSNSPVSYSFTDMSINSEGLYIYRLRQTDIDGRFKYSGTAEIFYRAVSLDLSQNYPNPFNPVTVINYRIGQDSRISINIYNSLGEKVIALADEYKTAGSYSVDFNASGMPGGIYYYILKTDMGIMTGKMIHLK
ncbi:MAG: T9SS type A sorting domain-containing protein [Syntrophothermus sp.]